MPPPFIALEEHFSSAVPAALTARYSEQLKHVPNVLAKLTDLGDRRRHDMDAGGVVDYQFQANEAGLAWIRELEASGLVDEEQLRAIAYWNAERLLGVKAPPGSRGAA
ncbi:hypothetical protein C8A00DRAFT_35106 [Chaetomidium leptoderma]|uniref:Amidohydrolase-related domain-containing protein n=1 Tax=Chaetomidium leptoderma TaxID=669021 RepID=A0AAN6ZUB0_9PEZI|nr:hypothetical protein C8A00DRAFT_35106 [Chaetomidium leptoderma]